jgi:hypothetical protein
MSMMRTTFILLPALFLAASCGNDKAPANRASVSVVQLAQQMNNTEYQRGEEVLYELKDIAEDRSAPEVQQKSLRLLEAAKKIDGYAANQIVFLENLKMELLRSLGENPDPQLAGEPADILQILFDPRNPFRPSFYRLTNVKYTGTTDFLENGSDNATEIVRQLETFREQVTEKIAESSSLREEHYFFKAPMIRDFASAEELSGLLDKSIQASYVSPDDQEMIKMIYFGLTFRRVQWQELLAKDCPWETAFQLLNHLQYKVLKARADALTVIRQRVGGENYSFNKVIVLTPGPEYAKAGTDVNFDVLMAAFDSNKLPVVTITEGEGHLVETREGKTTISAQVPQTGSVTLSGTISILNKSGIPRTMPWTKTITAVE